MLKFACLGLKSCSNNRGNKNGDYEIVSYGGEEELKSAGSDQSWRHSTQVDTLDIDDGPVRSRHVPNFDVYAKTRTLVRQQTISLVQHGYYNDDSLNSSSSSGSNNSSTSECTCQIGCSCSFRSISRESTEIPSSLVTKTTFNTIEPSMFSPNSSSDGEFYTMMSTNVTSRIDHGIYVCTSGYKSSIKGDLNAYVGERFMVLHMPKNNQCLLVRSLASQKCGYVPKSCLTPLIQK